jgi:hypothetical protein
MSREDIIRHLESLRPTHPTANLAFYAYRDLSRTEPEPFFHAALSRNPVSIEATRAFSDTELASHVLSLTPQSIYDDAARLAQPDEVWNFRRGDGLEQLILLANLIRARHPNQPLTLLTSGQTATLKSHVGSWSASTSKHLPSETMSL